MKLGMPGVIEHSSISSLPSLSKWKVSRPVPASTSTILPSWRTKSLTMYSRSTWSKAQVIM